MKNILILTFAFLSSLSFAQERKENAPIQQVTVFKNGAQVEHTKSITLSTGKQFVIFEKLTEFVDPSSIQLKCSENATILSVRVRKNYDETSLKETDLKKLTASKKVLETKKSQLEDDYHVLLVEEELMQNNSRLWSNQSGVKVAELKEAVTYYHTKLTETAKQKTIIQTEIENLTKQINTVEQEINTRSSLPVTIYSEVVVELSADRAGEATFNFSYITPKAFWKPYYDMRSDGIGSAVALEAKGLVSQNTGIEWKNVKLILSTNDPYDNTQEPNIEPWYLDYYSALPQRQASYRPVAQFNYNGETIHGEVLDISTGEPLAFAKISMSQDGRNFVTTDAMGKFSFQVPRNENAFNVSYLGYTPQYLSINAPYYKIALIPEAIVMESIDYTIAGDTFTWDAEGQQESYNAVSPMYDQKAVYSLSQTEVVMAQSRRKKGKVNASPPPPPAPMSYGNTVSVSQVVKDLRMEFVIETPFTIPSDNADHRVPIAVYQMPATYEYHSVPKFDEGVFLVAQISGWEKLNLLSGESNIYFDGTYIGKTYIDVNSTKDTLSFSLGKDNKIKVERKKSQEMSKTRLVGSRYKYEVTWDYTVRNNGGGAIPIIIKDQFPISTNSDIKVKEGSYDGAKYDENTHILTWEFTTKPGESKTFKFDFSVDYGKTQPVYLE